MFWNLYRHGTGHGVGHFLNVHEGKHYHGVIMAKLTDLVLSGPQGIGVRIGIVLFLPTMRWPVLMQFEAYNNTAMKPGMTVSNGGQLSFGNWAWLIQNRTWILCWWEIWNTHWKHRHCQGSENTEQFWRQRLPCFRTRHDGKLFRGLSNYYIFISKL